MILKEDLQKIIDHQKDWFQSKNEIKREVILPKTKHVKIITGIRRCGKSTLLKQMIKKHKHALFLSFEDSRLIGFDSNDFSRLSELTQKKEHIFFDEMQNIPKWEIFIRQLHAEGKNIFITGSNANLLSKELGTRLTGRHIQRELFPFSYKEFLEFKKVKKGISSFDKYFSEGGFPEYIEDKEEYILQQLLEDIVVKDITARYGLKDENKLKRLASYFITNSGKEMSLNKLTKTFGIGSATSTSNYVSYFEESYMIFVVPRFAYSLKKQEVNPKKIYAIDTGFIRANSRSFSKDDGRVLENVVFLHLRRRYKDIYYFRGEGECDFIYDNNALQVCFDLNKDNQEREFRGLLEALKELKVKEGLILTYKQEDTFEVDGYKIVVKPVWKWLLE